MTSENGEYGEYYRERTEAEERQMPTALRAVSYEIERLEAIAWHAAGARRLPGALAQAITDAKDAISRARLVADAVAE